MHVHQELDQFLACILLRTIRQMIKLRDRFAEPPYLFLKLAAVFHTSPFR
jgi:hypothetical protein